MELNQCLGQQYKYDLRDTFPALTKRIFFRGIFEELMLYFQEKQTTIF